MVYDSEMIVISTLDCTMEIFTVILLVFFSVAQSTAGNVSIHAENLQVCLQILPTIFLNSDFRLIRQTPKTVFKIKNIPKGELNSKLMAHEASVNGYLCVCINFGAEERTRVKDRLKIYSPA